MCLCIDIQVEVDRGIRKDMKWDMYYIVQAGIYEGGYRMF